MDTLPHNARLTNIKPCEPEYRTLVSALQAAAEEDGNALYVNLLDTHNKENRLTFSDVYWGATRFAHDLIARGLEPKDRVLMMLPTSADFLFAFYGIQMAGAVPVPCAFPVGLGSAEPYVLGLSHIVANAEPRFLITTETLHEPAAVLMSGVGEVLLSGDLGRSGRNETIDVGLAPTDLAILQYTSGPLEAPTGAALTHRNALANVCGLGRALSITRDDIALFWVPLVHDMGLVGGLFTSLYWRIPLHMMPPQAFLMHPHRWLQNLSDYRATISVAPNSAYQMCTRRVREKQIAEMDLSSWRLALNGAEMVQPATVSSFVEKFSTFGFAESAMCPIYGLAENTLVACCPGLDTPYTTAPHPDHPENAIVSVGTPLTDQEIFITDDQGDVLLEGQIGEIRIAGPCVMSGYFGNDHTSIDRHGRLRTGDLGFVQNGQLFISGRAKEMIIKMGRNYFPDDIEQMIKSALSDRVAGIVAFAEANPKSGTEDLIVVAETSEEDHKRLKADLSAAILAVVGIRADRAIFVPPGTIPSGSKREQRAHLHRKLVAGEFEATA